MASLSGDDSDNAAEETVVTRTRSRSGRSTVKSPRRGRKKGPQGRPTRSSGRKLAAHVEVEDEEQIEEYVAVPVEQVAEDNMRASDQSDIYEPMQVEHRVVEEYIVEEDVAYEDANAEEIGHEENGLVDENGDVEPEAVEESNVVEEGYAQMEEEVESGEEGKVEYEIEEEEAGDEERVEEGRFEEEAVIVALEEEEDARADEEAADEQVEREGNEMTREEEYPEEEEREYVQEEMEDAGISEDGSEGVQQPPTAEESALESVTPMEEEENSTKGMEEEEQKENEKKSQPCSGANDDVSPASPEPEPMLMNPSLYTQDSNSIDDSKEIRTERVDSPPKEESLPPVAPVEESQEDGQKKRKRKTRFSLDAEGEVSLDSLAAPAKKVARGDGDSSAADAVDEKKSPRRAEAVTAEEENSVEVKNLSAEGGEASSDADNASKKKSKSKKMVSINLNLPSGKDETRPVAVKRLASGVGATAAALLAEAAAAAKATASSEDKKKSGSKNQKRKMLTVDGDTYDPSSPTSENSCDESMGRKGSRDKQDKARRLSSGSTPSNTGTSSASSTTLEKAKKTLPELEKYWKAVKEDPSDFTGWTYLLQYVDQENDVEAAREAYDSFLAYYPYCYGYWRKYADYEKKKGNKQRCQEVFERGLKAIPLSVDLWMHYLNFCKTSAYVDDEDSIRQQFENGVAACGMEFRSDRLWDHYVKWETEGKRFQNVTAIYDRVLQIPTQNHANHFENFVQHIMAHPPQKVLSVDEFLTLRREVLQQLKQNESTSVLSEVHPPAPGADDDDAPPGMEDAPPGDEDDAPPTPSKPSITRSDEETTALREKVIAIRRETHKTTGAMVAARWNYEEGIKRPYFHVKQLERCQLKNWKEYLDFEIEQGDQERIITLFERCLIPCALYEEFWIRFVRYLEAMGEEMVEKVREVYFRACTIHHTKKPTLHLYWAAFEESQGNYAKSAEILMNLEKIMPNLLQVAYRLINLERRRGNLDKVCSLYEHYITTSKNKTVATNMAIKYARFSWKVMGDVEKAIKILRDELEKEKENPRLYLQLISMGLQKDPFDEKEIIAIFDEFLSKEGVETEQKVIFAQRKVEFLEDFGMDIMSVQKAYDEFQRFTKMAKDRKRKSGDGDKGDGHSKKKMSADSSQQAQQQQSAQSPGQSSAYQQQAGQAAGTYKPADYAASGTTTVSATAASGQYTQPPYPGGQYPPPQQGPPPPYGGQAPYPAGQYNQTTDPNYAGYQNWGYSQTGYGYNQGWGGYNYY